MNVTMNGKPVTVHGNARGWYDVESEGKRLKVRRAALEYEVEVGAAQVTTPTTNSNEEQAMSVQTETSKTSKTSKPKTSKPKTSKPKTSKPKTSKKAAPKKAAPKNGAAKSITRETESGKQYTYQYAGKTESGAVSYDCGDETAKALRNKTLPEVFDIVAKQMLKSGDLKGDFAGCTTADGIERKLRSSLKDANHGRQRMSLGNRLRALLRNKASK